VAHLTFLVRKANQAASLSFSLSRAAAQRAQCATHQSSQPTSYSLLPFLFLSDADRWGPAVRVTPYLQPRVSRALDGRRPLPAGLPRFPAFKCPHQAVVKPTFTLPPSIDSFPLLIPPPS
jgi:hypothetical protein